MENLSEYQCRHFTSYSGIALPLKLVNELDEASRDNRNTYFRGYYDDGGRLHLCEKVVYGEIELTHRYEYDENGVLRSAEITDVDEEPKRIQFDCNGRPQR